MSGTRNEELDFTKGAMILSMVAAHAVQYFCYSKAILNHLYFPAMGFIFVTGFLVTNARLAKYTGNRTRMAVRLFLQGGKLLVLFTLLNVAASFFVRTNDGHRAMGLGALLADLGPAYLTGNSKVAIFEVLAPIAYLLILSGVLVLLRRGLPVVLVILFASLLATILILRSHGISYRSLCLFIAGIGGLAAGCMPAAAVHALARRWWIGMLLTIAYQAAILAGTIPFTVRLAGDIAVLLLIYSVSLRLPPGHRVKNFVVTMGRHSLLGYVAQIAWLQLLRRALPSSLPVPQAFGAGLAAAAVLTVATILLTDRARRRWHLVDGLYRLVFA